MLQNQIINFTISITISAVSLMLALHAWRKRQVQGAIWFGGLLIAVSWVNWWSAFEAVVGFDVNAYISLSKLEYIGTALIPILWVRFAVHFSGRELPFALYHRVTAFFVAGTTILLAFTNEYHGLIWAKPAFTMIAGSPVFDPQYGMWFWVNFVYSYIIFSIGSVMLVRYAMDTWRLYRFQAILILIATALPWLGNLLSIFDALNPVPYLYINGLLTGLSMVFMALGVLRLRLLDVSPLAYDTILNNIPAGILVLDLQNRILAVNESVKTILQSRHNDLVGQPMEFALPYCAPELMKIMQSAEHSGQIKMHDRVYSASMSTAYTRDGTERGNLFVFSDVTHEIQAKQAQEAEEAFSEMINRLGTTLSSSLNVKHIASLILENLEQMIPGSRLNIMLVDDDGYSTRLYQHRGYSTEEMLLRGDVVFDYRISPLFVQAVLTPSLHVAIGVSNHIDNAQFASIKSDDTFATIAIMGEGKPIGFINIDAPRTHTFTPELRSRLQIFGQQAALAIKNAQLYEQTRHQAEELKSRVGSLMITQQVYKDIGFSVDSDQLVQLILDAALRISRADAGFVALLKNNQLEAMNIYGDYDIDMLRSILNSKAGIIHQTLAGQRSLILQLPNVLESGFKGVTAQIGLPLMTVDDDTCAKDETARLYGIIVLETRKTTRFTEDRMQLLELIRDRAAVALQNGQLLTRVQERAAELEILYGKVSYLEQFKTDMIRIAAHDLKNPLGVIRNYLTMLIESPELELDLDRVYPSMLRSAERMLQIVQNFLSMDRIEKAAQLQTVTPFDLSLVVQKVVEEFSMRAEQKNQYVDVMIAQDNCVVQGDEAQIYEAVANFMSNAIKYTPDGGHIRVLLEADYDSVQFEITDNGFGIPEEKQGQLFQAFYRASTQETAGIEGTGLGLHLTKTIIEQQDGEIIFSSVYHQGSTFGFKMPLYHIEPETAAIVERVEKLAG